MSPEKLAQQKAEKWRERATMLRHYEATPQAATLERLADELETMFSDYLDEALTLADAAEESGYDPSHLGRLLRQGRIPDTDSDEAPRIRRRDLPRKPGSTWAETHEPGSTENGTRTDAVDAVLQDHEETSCE